MEAGDSCRVQIDSQTLYVDEREYHLTPMEARLLQLLVEYEGNIVSYESIFYKVWKTTYIGDRCTLQVHVSWLRKKLGDAARIRVKPNVGYIYETQD